MNTIVLFDENGELLAGYEVTEKTQNQLLVKSYQLGQDHKEAKLAFTTNGYTITFGDKSGKDKLTNDIRIMSETEKSVMSVLLQE